MSENLSMPATLGDALMMASVATADDFIEVSGDLKAIILWTVHSDGSRSVLDMYFWE